MILTAFARPAKIASIQAQEVRGQGSVKNPKQREEKNMPDKAHRLKTCATKGIQVVERALAVVEFLAAGEILEWKTLEEVARGIGRQAGTPAPMSSCHRILITLVECGWAEKGPKGWRQDSAGIIRHSEYAQSYLNRKLAEHGRHTND